MGLDLGGSRAWSAGVASYWNGRTEAIAVAPSIPSIAEQEERDGVDRNTYQRLVDQGQLIVAHGLRIPDPSILADYVRTHWRPVTSVCEALLHGSGRRWNSPFPKP